LITDDEYTNWLINGGHRVALIEVATDNPRYLSTVPYITLPTDTPPNQAYQPVVAGGFAFSEKLSLDGNPTISVGDIELSNEDGGLDAWLSDVWVNRAVNVYIGDADWPREDFRLEFSGIIADLNSSNPDRLNVVLRSKLERLNTPVVEATLGGATTNKDRLLPILLGECHNIEPLLTDPANHEYMIHDGPMERIIEVRDNGVPISNITPYLLTGKVKLGNTPAGTVTVSAQGAVPYASTVASAVQILALEYGTPTERLTDEDLDIETLAIFDAANPQPIGVFMSDRANVLQTCQELAASIGAQVVMTRQGLLRLVKLAMPTEATLTVEPSDYEINSLTIRGRSTVLAGVKLGYCKNWTVQETLDTGIPAEHKDLFSQEWLTVSAQNSTVAALYRLYAESPQVDTLLLKSSDAQAEADRRLALWSTPRTVYGFTGFAHLLTVELGQAVILKGSRWDLQDGKVGIIVSIDRDWIAGRCAVEVLI
jgi:hypothetical protein